MRIFPVVGREVLGGLDAKTPAAVGADRQALQQVNPGGFLVGLYHHPPAGAYGLAAFPQFFGDDWLMLPFDTRGCVERKLTPLGRTVIPR